MIRPEQNTRPVQENMKTKTILVVDDDAQIRSLLRSSLEKQYTVLEASGYFDAISFLKHPINVAIIDYLLPDRDGFQVLKILREVQPNLPVIIMTGHSDENLVIKAIRKDVADYVKKPLDLKYLRERLSDMFTEDRNYQEPARIEARVHYVLDGIASYIEANYMHDLNLEKISKMACMSRFRFCRAFKERFGRSFISSLNAVRIRKASELLRNPNYSIQEISYIVGYGNAGHFNRVFKTVHKISPREYRKKMIEIS
jgi:YesN/AraC family two-component response regulator